jgi:branched-chain amino acid transport system substrate-binding protein
MQKNEVLPYKVGVMMDMPGFPGASDVFDKAVQFALDEAYRGGVIDRPAITVLKEHLGQPWGDGYASRNAFKELAEKDQVLAIAGPFTTDNSMAILDMVESYRIPTMTICGSQNYVGRYAFNTSNGNLADEPAYIACWLKKQGHKKIAVIRDYPSKIGVEYYRFFEYAAQQFGLEIVGVGNVCPAPTELDMTEVIGRMKNTSPDALVYLGFGEACRVLNAALHNNDWWPERVMTTAFVQATYHEFFAKLIDGWYGVDQYHEGNSKFSSMLARYKEKHGAELPRNSMVSSGYDIGQCIASGFARMELATPESMAVALETIRMMPACTGGPGTYISFGPYDHRGFKGIDYLVMRKSEGGKTTLVDFNFGS